MKSMTLMLSAAIGCTGLAGCVPVGPFELIDHAAKLSQPGGWRVPRPPAKPPVRPGPDQHYNPRTGHYYDRHGRRVTPPRPALPGYHYNPRTGHYYDRHGSRVDYRGRRLRFLPFRRSRGRRSAYTRVPMHALTFTRRKCIR